MSVPYIFATATSNLPLAQLDANFTYFTDAITVASGNVGIGVIPNSWYQASSPYKAMQIGVTGSIFSRTGNEQIDLASNVYATGSGAYAYITSGNYASMYQQDAGSHSWYNAPVGTAGSTITFSERMRIDSNGNVGIGATTITSQVSGTATVLQLKGAASGIGSFKVTDATDAVKVELWSSVTGVAGLSTTTAHPLLFSTSNTERMRIDDSGNVSIGTGFTATPAQGLVLSPASNSFLAVGHASGSATGTYYHIFNYNGTVIGTVSQNGTTGVLYNTTSDYRLKENVQPISNGLDRVAQLKPVTYQWKSDGSDGEGFIAHELAEVCPLAVSGEKDAVDADGKIIPQGIDPSKVVAVLTAAIQELKAELDSVKSQLAALQGN